MEKFQPGPSKKASWERFFNLFIKKNCRSITRELQYEHLKNLKLDGRLLDVGGGEQADYRQFLNCLSYKSVNINPEMQPTWLTQVGDNFDHIDELFDFVISLNTFEHVLDAEKLLNNVSAVLRDGGRFYAATPFLYPVHGSPDDFFRPTGSWWFEILSRNGFEDIKITPLVWGPFTTGATCSGLPGPFKSLRTLISLVLDVVYVGLKFNRHEQINGLNGASFQNCALSYFIEAQKFE